MPNNHLNLLPMLQNLRSNYQSGVTQDCDFRITQLKKLKAAILKQEDALFEALNIDLNKSKEEAWITELGFVIAEIDTTLKHLKNWMRPKKESTNLLNLPSTSYLYTEPLGVVLIIAPWNYPFQLLINPLVGAIAAGNTCVLKSSEFAPATSAAMKL
jgi:aldehyde dehydrogenase (NAD+)